MFTRTLQCSFNDSLDSWQTYVAAVKTQSIEQDTLLLKFWPFDEDKSGKIPKNKLEGTGSVPSGNQDPDTCPTLEEFVEECVCIRNLVVGVRTPQHFMRSFLSSEVPKNCEGMYLIATHTKIINCRGVGAEDLTRQILSRR